MTSSRFIFTLVSDSIGGAEISTFLLAREINAIGLSAIVVCLAPSELSQELLRMNFWVSSTHEDYSLRIENALAEEAVLITTHRNHSFASTLWPEVKTYCVCRQVPIDGAQIRIFQQEMLVATTWAEMTGILRGATIIAPSRQVAIGLEKFGCRARFLIPNPVEIVSNRRCSRPVPFLHNWARPVRWKRLRLLEAAFARLWTYSDVSLHMVAPVMRHPRIHAAGFSASPWQRAAMGDIYAAPSEVEAFGRDVFEALSAGCVAVAVRGTPGADVIVATGAGVVLEPAAGETEWADALENLIRMPTARRSALGAVAADFVASLAAPPLIARCYCDTLIRL
jgi:glycosyltransferase involved in cell wall biosynthesis